MKKEKILIFIHGFKKKGKNDFDIFLKNNIDELSEYKIIKVNYYDGNDKSTINPEYFDNVINKIFKKYEKSDVKVIAYSFGCLLALKNARRYNNIKNIYLSMPTLFIDYKEWVNYFKLMRKKEKILKKKLGKERYKIIKSKMFDKYPVRIGKSINKYISNNRKNISEISGRNISIIYSKDDEISVPEKTIPFLIEKLSNNDLSIKKIKGKHFATFDKKNSDSTKHLIDFIISNSIIN